MVSCGFDVHFLNAHLFMNLMAVCLLILYPLNNNVSTIPSAKPWHMPFCSVFDYSRYLIKVKSEYFFFCVWLILLSVMCSRLIIVLVCESFSSSLRLYPTVCVCVCARFVYLFIC